MKIPKQFINKIILSIYMVCSFSVFSQRDTFAFYQMGAIERIDGLSYGSCHELLLFTDSTFNYQVEKAMQISTSIGTISTGHWALKNNVLILDGTDEAEARFDFSTCSYNEIRSNVLVRFYLGECISCLDLSPFTIYYHDRIIVMPLEVYAQKFMEHEMQLKYPVSYLRADLEIDLVSVDSIAMFGQTLVPAEENFNELSFTGKPVFLVNLTQKGDVLQVMSQSTSIRYEFHKVK